MRYKGRYAAQVVIDIDFEPDDKSLPFESIKEGVSKELTPELDRLVKEYIAGEDEGCKVTVTQNYADLYKVEGEA